MKLLYIASENRSGSTLLDLLLGGHSQTFGVGEISRLHQFFQRNDPCTCGQFVQNCPTWSDVFVELHERGFNVENFETRVRNRPRRLPIPSLAELSFMTGKMASRFAFLPPVKRSLVAAERVWSVCDILHQKHRCDWIVDSSKRAEQLSAMYVVRPEDIRVLHLVRDGRAVSYSMATRTGNSFERATRSWLLNSHLQLKLQNPIPAAQKLFLKYEDLCKNPTRTLSLICEFMEIDYEESMLHPSVKERHNIGGSPRKHDSGELKISLDERWISAMTDSQAKFFDRWAGKLNMRFGYSRDVPQRNEGVSA